jgi:hypothetical protein
MWWIRHHNLHYAPTATRRWHQPRPWCQYHHKPHQERGIGQGRETTGTGQGDNRDRGSRRIRVSSLWYVFLFLFSYYMTDIYLLIDCTYNCTYGPSPTTNESYLTRWCVVLAIPASWQLPRWPTSRIDSLVRHSRHPRLSSTTKTTVTNKDSLVCRSRPPRPLVDYHNHQRLSSTTIGLPRPPTSHINLLVCRSRPPLSSLVLSGPLLSHGMYEFFFLTNYKHIWLIQNLYLYIF